MRIISRKALRVFWEAHPDARQPLQTWYADVKSAHWRSPSDLKHIYQTASFVGRNRVVFNIRGNKYRLIVAVQYKFQLAFVRFVGTHAEYNRIDAATV
jgi:mRNA interferase HigB